MLKYAIVLLGGLFFLINHGHAFAVAKNVSSGSAPAEKRVLFEKGKTTADALTFEDAENCRFSIDPEGNLICHLIGSDAAKPVLHWKATGSGPASFDASQFTYLVITCRVEGSVTRTIPNQKSQVLPRGNLWIGPVFINGRNEQVGYISLADMTEDTVTPEQTATFNIPIAAFIQETPSDFKAITGIGFPIPKGRSTDNRDLRWVIEKIALAD